MAWLDVNLEPFPTQIFCMEIEKEANWDNPRGWPVFVQLHENSALTFDIDSSQPAAELSHYCMVLYSRRVFPLLHGAP